MKKTNLLLLMLLSCAMLCTSCKGEDPSDETKKVTLAVLSDSGVITITGIDIVKDIQIKSAEIVERDIEVDIQTDATDGSAILSVTKATISKGTNNVIIKVTFPASKFPPGATEQAIKVTASTNAKNVTIPLNFTIFTVNGGEKIDDTPATLTAKATSLEWNTTDNGVYATIKFQLSKPISEAVEITCEYDILEDFVGSEGVIWNPYPVKIPARSTYVQLSIFVPQGRSGSMPIKISCANSNVKLETTQITLKFIISSLVSISTSSALSQPVVVGDQDVVKTIDVTLSKAVDKNVTVTLLPVSNKYPLNGTLSETTVTFLPGEISKSVDITFSSNDFTTGVFANVMVTAYCTDISVERTNAMVTFGVSGGKLEKQDGQIKYVFYRTHDTAKDLVGTVTFTANEKTVGFIDVTTALDATNTQISRFEPAVYFDYTVSGELTKEDIVLKADFNLLHTPYGYALFKIMASAIGKTGTLEIISDGVTFLDNQTWTISVN